MGQQEGFKAKEFCIQAQALPVVSFLTWVGQFISLGLGFLIYETWDQMSKGFITLKFTDYIIHRAHLPKLRYKVMRAHTPPTVKAKHKKSTQTCSKTDSYVGESLGLLKRMKETEK